MRWEIEILKKEGIVSSKYSGKINYDQLIQKVSESISNGKKKGINTYLIDNRNLKSDLSVTDIYNLSRVFIEKGIYSFNKIAVIYNTKTIKNEDLSFFETVFQNQGLNLQLFTNKNQALEWLKK